MKYTVMPGDTLYQIANRYGVPVDELLKANPDIKDPNLIYPGQLIEIPVDKVPGGEFPEPEYPPEFPPAFPPGFSPRFPPGFPPGPALGEPLPTWPPVYSGFLPGFPATPPDFLIGYPSYVTGMPGEIPGMVPPLYQGMSLPGHLGIPEAAGCPCGGMTPGEARISKLGDMGPHVRYLQERLRELGYYRGPITGCFGPRTRFAVRKFQRDCNVPDSGIVDRNLWASIGWYW